MPEATRRTPRRRTLRRPPQLPRVERARLTSAMFADFCRQHERCVVSFPWGDQTYTFTYRPSGRLLQEGRALSIVPEQQWAALAGLLARNLTSWDIRHGGAILPITEENISGFAAGLSLRMVRELVGDFTRRVDQYLAEQQPNPHGH